MFSGNHLPIFTRCQRKYYTDALTEPVLGSGRTHRKQVEEDIVHYSQAKGKGYSVIVTADFPYKSRRRNEENIVAEFKRKKAPGVSCLIS